MGLRWGKEEQRGEERTGRDQGEERRKIHLLTLPGCSGEKRGQFDSCAQLLVPTLEERHHSPVSASRASSAFETPKLT